MSEQKTQKTRKYKIGQTLPKWNPDTPNVSGWEPINAHDFKLRTEGYISSRVKAPSNPSLYECVGCDLYERKTKLSHISRLMDLGLDPEAKVGLLPEVIVINCLMPAYAPSLFGSQSDGPGYAFVIYYKMSDALKQRVAAANGDIQKLQNCDRLIKRFVESKAKVSDGGIRDRFKAIAQITNLPDVALSGTSKTMVRKYNGTPFLVRTTAAYFSGPNYFEFNIDVHRFGYPARLGLHSISDLFETIVFDFAYVIQGNNDEELPENLLGGCRIHYLMLSTATHFPPVHALDQ